MIISNNLNRYAYEGVEKHHKIKLKVTKLWKEYRAEQETEEKEAKDED